MTEGCNSGRSTPGNKRVRSASFFSMWAVKRPRGAIGPAAGPWPPQERRVRQPPYFRWGTINLRRCQRRIAVIGTSSNSASMAGGRVVALRRLALLNLGCSGLFAHGMGILYEFTPESVPVDPTLHPDRTEYPATGTRRSPPVLARRNGARFGNRRNHSRAVVFR